jgi:flagellar protein FliL
MSDAVEPTETEASAPEQPPKRSRAVVGFLIAGLAAGSLAGAFVAGPLLARKLAPHTPADSATAAAAHAKADDSSTSASAPVHLIDNLVLNPAGTGATRFLLVSVGVQTANTAAQELLKAREIEARDAVLRVLSVKHVEDLANTANRDGYKHEIKLALDSVFGAGFTKRIYFSQFVIQ